MADYYYTDANRQPAGPVPFEQLKAMHEQGQLANGALAAEVGADEWQPVSSLFGQPASGDVGYSAPPITPTGNIGRPQDDFIPLAGWAFGLGIASWVCAGALAGVPAVILGHMALGRIKAENNTNGTAKVLAIIGLVAGYVSIAFTILWLVLVVGFGVMGGIAGMSGSGSGP